MDIITKIIWGMVLFMIGYLVFLLLRLLALPLWGKIGIPALPPPFIWKLVWAVISKGLNYVSIAILFFTAIVAIIWFFVIPLIPNVFGLPKMVKGTPPFPQYDRAGIFRLLQDIGKIIFSTKPFDKRVEGVFVALGQFLGSSTKFLSSALVQIVGKNNIKKLKLPPPPSPSISLPGQSAATTATTTTTTEPQDKSSSFTEDEDRQLKDDFQQCMDENIVPVYPTDTPMDKASALLKNNTAEIVCQTGQFKSFLNILSFR